MLAEMMSTPRCAVIAAQSITVPTGPTPGDMDALINLKNCSLDQALKPTTMRCIDAFKIVSPEIPENGCFGGIKGPFLCECGHFQQVHLPLLRVGTAWPLPVITFSSCYSWSTPLMSANAICVSAGEEENVV